MNQSKKLALAAAGMMAFAQGAFAIEVTVNDQEANSPGSAPVGIAGEDQETEDPALSTQIWDLEGLAINGNTLSIVGGFPMTTYNPGYSFFRLGDLFIDTDNNALLPPGSGAIIPVGGAANLEIPVGGKLFNSTFKYDYVVHFTRAANTITGFNVYQLDSSSVLRAILDQGTSATLLQLRQSNPYAYLPGDNSVNKLVGSGSISYTTGLPNGTIDGVPVTGGLHNDLKLTFNSGVNPLLLAEELHITVGCGNDNMLGHVTGGGQVPDGGATLVLLGLGFASLTLAKRKSSKD
jgi:hypothetical protein